MKSTPAIIPNFINVFHTVLTIHTSCMAKVLNEWTNSQILERKHEQNTKYGNENINRAWSEWETPQ